MLVDDTLLHLAGSQVGVADEQGDLVVLIQVGPQLVGESINVSGDGNTLGLALEGRDHGVAVADVGVQEVTQTGGGGVFPDVSDEMLSMIDVLVDGRFVQELKNISLKFRGSSNQRILDVQKTLQSGEITLYAE